MDALEKAAAYLNRKPHTEKEVIDYLRRKGYEPEEAEAAAAKLREYGYIDDLAYSRMYFEYGFEKGRGRERIIRELNSKGIPGDLADQAYESLEEKPDELEMARAIAARILVEDGRDTNGMSYDEKQKLQAKIARRLASRGFSGSVCWSVARNTIES